MKRVSLLVLAVTLTASAHAAPVRPVGRYAPKGLPPGGIAPGAQSPQVQGRASNARGGEYPGFAGVEGAGTPHVNDTKYLYAATRTVTGPYTHGAGATMLQGEPALGMGDSHTLAEIWVASADRQQIVEIGWTIDPAVNSDVQPRLFVFHWVDGRETCYNGCGFIQTSVHKTAGLRVIAGEAHRYEIKLIGEDWWCFYDGEALGYFPQSEWGGRFKQVDQVQWFGEVAAATTTPCTQMGNGRLGTDFAAAYYRDLHLFATDGSSVPAIAEVGAVTNPELYNLESLGPSELRFGGPGALTGCCRSSTCSGVNAECGNVDDPVCAGHVVACGTCETIVCTADHKCPGGVGPRDDGYAFDTPADTSAGCCDAGGPPGGPLALAAAVALVVRRRRGICG